MRRTALLSQATNAGSRSSAFHLLSKGWEELMKSLTERIIASDETGAIGYIFLWLLGVPASLLFVVFLLRGCN